MEENDKVNPLIKWLQIVIELVVVLLAIGASTIVIKSDIAIIQTKVETLEATVNLHNQNFVPRTEWENTISSLKEDIKDLRADLHNMNREK